MIGLSIREKDIDRVRRELNRFRVPYEEKEGSTIFVLPVIRRRNKRQGRHYVRFEESDIYNVLLYLTQIGIKARLLFPI